MEYGGDTDGYREYRNSRTNPDCNSCVNYFWAEKLPEIGKAAGQTLREFKSSANNLIDDDSSDENKNKEKEKEKEDQNKA